MKIILVVGARPNFMKIAPILEAIDQHNGKGRRPKIDPVLVHTGQHYDRAMSQSFFEDLGMPRPDINLEVGSGSHAEQTGKVMMAFEPVLLRERPDLVLVVGDVNSTLACTLAAKKLNFPVAHVEAGLRSGDLTMPEEINRKVTDCLSDYLFTSEPSGNENLAAEGIQPGRIYFVGNVMIDSLLEHRERAATSTILEELDLRDDRRVKPYGVVTLHRPSNVDSPGIFGEICEALATLSKDLPLVFPCHPRTREKIRAFGIRGLREGITEEWNGVMLTPPLGYLDFLWLAANAKIILTDSGGIQEEATVLGVPCLTLRENTERPATVLQGTNRLVGTDKRRILRGFELAMGEPTGRFGGPEKWDGRAAERIVEIVARIGRKRSMGSREDTPIPTAPGNGKVVVRS
jgi:UDP-N-acetylglucosamine 2-epimerase (non-hydrolysing)